MAQPQERYNLRSRIVASFSEGIADDIGETSNGLPTPRNSNNAAAISAVGSEDLARFYNGQSAAIRLESPVTPAGVASARVRFPSQTNSSQDAPNPVNLDGAQTLITDSSRNVGNTETQVEPQEVLTFLNETFFSKLHSSTPSAPHHTPQLKSELTELAKNLMGIVDRAKVVVEGNSGLLIRDSIRTELLTEYPKFHLKFQIFNDNRGKVPIYDPFMMYLGEVCSQVEQTLGDLGLVAKQGVVAPRGVAAATSDVGSSASKASSTSSQAIVNLILSHAKNKAQDTAREEREKLRITMHQQKLEEAAREAEIKKRQIEADYQMEELKALERNIDRRVEEHADELALKDLEAMERGLPLTAGAIQEANDGKQYSGFANSKSEIGGSWKKIAPEWDYLPEHKRVLSVDQIPQSKQVSFIEKPVTDNQHPTENREYTKKSSAAKGYVAKTLWEEKTPSDQESKYVAVNQYDRNYGDWHEVPAGKTVAWTPGEVYKQPVNLRPAVLAEQCDTKEVINEVPAGKTVAWTPGEVYKQPVTARPAVLAEQCDTKEVINNTSSPSPITVQLGDEFRELLKQNRLPPGEPPLFDGTRLEEYLPFRSSFEALISENCYSDEQRYRLLLKYTAKDALSLVHSCHGPDISQAYRQALQQLDARYGNKYKLAQYYIGELHNWPVVKDGDADSLSRLSLYLTRIKNMMQRGEEWSQLNSIRELHEFAEKLPYRLRRSWAEKVCMLQHHEQLANFEDLAAIVQKEADILAFPGMAGLLANKNAPMSKTSPRQLQKSSVRVLSTDPGEDTSASEASHSNSFTNKDQITCLYCERTGHSLPKCRSFASRSFDSRKEWLFRNKVCFKCLSGEHYAKDCEVSVKCSICRSTNHIDAMHKPTLSSGSSPAGSNTIAMLTNNVSGSTWCPLVPVEVSSPSGQRCFTYAALDTWASSSFMSSDLAKALQTVGEPKPLKVTTVTGKEQMLKSSIVRGLSIRGIDCQQSFFLSNLYQVKDWPFSRSDVPPKSLWESYDHLKHIPATFLESGVGLLLGQSDSALLRVIETVSGQELEPYATRHAIGWALQGSVSRNPTTNRENCFRTEVAGAEEFSWKVDESKDVIRQDLEALYRAEFFDPDPGLKGNSREDKIWKEKVEQSLCYKGQKMQIDLPFKDAEVHMPDNKYQAYKCVMQLRKRLEMNSTLKRDYTEFMEKMISNGHLEAIPDVDLEAVPGKVWYLIHHPVRHKIKKKLRVVFDCSREFHGYSLNKVLMQGPNLLNKLVGVLLRFREYNVAFVGDIEQMFLQLKVPKEHSDYMRLFWWPGGDLQEKPMQFRLTCHTFGAVSSPSIANFAVKKAAEMAKRVCLSARDALADGAYMDDVLYSAPTAEEAHEILSVVREAAAHVGFNLRGIISNSRELLAEIDRDVLASNCIDLDLGKDDLPNERVLGVVWLANDDAFTFKLNISTDGLPTTKRRLLSTLGSVFDPLGLVVPVLVPMRALFQRICSMKLEWDDLLNPTVESEWQRWLHDIHNLEKVRIPRCITRGLMKDLNKQSKVQLHVFADGSETAFAAVAYSRYQVSEDSFFCSLLMAKTRQVPITKGAYTTIPRIELGAAKLAVTLSLQIKRELSLKCEDIWYWTDSSTVLYYIRSLTGRFPRFVTNRVDYILQHSIPDNWHFVPSKLNIADIASRGCLASKLVQCSEWFGGPSFLSAEPIPDYEEPLVESSVLEVKVQVTLANENCESGAMFTLIDSTSSWIRILQRIYVFRGFIGYLANGQVPAFPPSGPAVKELELQIWKIVQNRCFMPQIGVILADKMLAKGDKLFKLSPTIFEGLLCVNSRVRLDSSGLSGDSYPIILPAEDHVVKTYIHYLHVKYHHPGRTHLISLIQEKYHVVGLNKLLKKLYSSCKICTRLNGRPLKAVMAPLPPARTNPPPRPFTSTGVDFFGPIGISQGRKSLKAYGVLFTCLASRAVHLEVAMSLDISSFLSAFRRFSSRRGCPSSVYSDQGTNLVGAMKVLRQELDKMEKEPIQRMAFEQEMEWVFSPPKASHFGGIWERLIRSTRRILLAVICERKRNLTHEELVTLFCEVEFILNARPLTPVSAESTDMGPITPNHLLIGARTPATAISSASSNLHFHRNRWKFVQHIADCFWKRWRKEYVPTLRLRPKWFKRSKNLEVGDMVMLVDGDLPRGSWPVAVIDSVHPSKDGVVRRVKVRLPRPGNSQSSFTSSVLERPIHKLVLVYRWSELVDPNL